jgi:hypothetical protein
LALQAEQGPSLSSPNGDFSVCRKQKTIGSLDCATRVSRLFILFRSLLVANQRLSSMSETRRSERRSAALTGIRNHRSDAQAAQRSSRHAFKIIGRVRFPKDGNLTTSTVHRTGSKSQELEMDIEKSTRYLGPSLAHDMPHEARSR